MTALTPSSRPLAAFARPLAKRPSTRREPRAPSPRRRRERLDPRDRLAGLAILAGLGVLAGLGAGCGGAPADGAAEKTGWTSSPVTVCPGGSTVKGVDVSVYQGSIDWTSVKGAGVDFAFARVSDGTANPDSTFAANWAGMKSAGVVRGVYQFFRASVDPTTQANLLLSAVGTLEASDLAPVADVEVMDGVSGATLVANLATWVSVIRSKTGRTPIVYTAPGFWNALPGTGQFGGETLWVANWQVSCPDTPTPWTAWKFWQNADNGSVPGISGAVDTDEFNGTLAELQGSGGAPADAAQFVGQSFPLASTTMSMTAGQVVPSYIELKNVGTKTWDSSTHLGTTQPRDRKSVFADGTWLGPDRPAGVKGTVPPGSTYKFTFDLAAPGTDGNYDEFFGLVQEGVAWFSDPGQGGPPDNDLEVKISVTGKAPAPDGGVAHGGDAGGAGGPGAADAGTHGGLGGDAGVGSAPGEGDGGVSVGSPGDDAGVGTAGGGSASSGDGAFGGHGGGCALGATHAGGGASPWPAGLGMALALSGLRRRRRRAGTSERG